MCSLFARICSLASIQLTRGLVKSPLVAVFYEAFPHQETGKTTQKRGAMHQDSLGSLGWWFWRLPSRIEWGRKRTSAFRKRDMAASQNVKPRSIPQTHRPIHTPDPCQNAGDPDRSIRLDHRGPIHTRILTQPHMAYRNSWWIAKNWNEMKCMKLMLWHESIDMHELKGMNWTEWTKQMNWNARIEINNLTWTNWNEWIQKWRTWNEWLEMNELKGMNCQKCSDFAVFFFRFLRENELSLQSRAHFVTIVRNWKFRNV